MLAENAHGNFSLFLQVQMTIVTALFMLPTAIVFPMLLRLANTPPSSLTLLRRRHWERRRTHRFSGDPESHDEYRADVLYQHHHKRREEDFAETLKSGESRSVTQIFSVLCPILTQSIVSFFPYMQSAYSATRWLAGVCGVVRVRAHFYSCFIARYRCAVRQPSMHHAASRGPGVRGRRRINIRILLPGGDVLFSARL